MFHGVKALDFDGLRISCLVGNNMIEPISKSSLFGGYLFMNIFEQTQKLLVQKADLQARYNLLPYDGTPEVKEKNNHKLFILEKELMVGLPQLMLDRLMMFCLLHC